MLYQGAHPVPFQSHWRQIAANTHNYTCVNRESEIVKMST